MIIKNADVFDEKGFFEKRDVYKVILKGKCI